MDLQSPKMRVGRGAGELRIGVGVDLALNSLSKRDYGAEVGEVGVIQQSYIVGTFPLLGRHRETQ